MNLNRISWDIHHMGLALLTAQRSPDPNTQVGACITNNGNRIVALGYNGTPSGISPSLISWSREGESTLDTKYPYIVHAEVNAILNATTSVEGCKLYTTLFTCQTCAAICIQSGIKEVVYLNDTYMSTESCRAAEKMYNLAGVSYRKFTGEEKLQLKHTFPLLMEKL